MSAHYKFGDGGSANGMGIISGQPYPSSPHGNDGQENSISCSRLLAKEGEETH